MKQAINKFQVVGARYFDQLDGREYVAKGQFWVNWPIDHEGDTLMVDRIYRARADFDNAKKSEWGTIVNKHKKDTIFILTKVDIERFEIEAFDGSEEKLIEVRKVD